jgi:hypothetical protein
VVDEVAAKVPNDADRQARWMITSERSDAKLWRFKQLKLRAAGRLG